MLNSSQFGHDHSWTFHRTYANKGIKFTGTDSDYEFKDKNNAVKNLRKWVSDSNVNNNPDPLQHVNTRVSHNGSGWVAEIQPRYCKDCAPHTLEQQPPRDATPEEAVIAKTGGDQYSDEGLSNLNQHLSRKHGNQKVQVEIEDFKALGLRKNKFAGNLKITEPMAKVTNSPTKSAPPVTEA